MKRTHISIPEKTHSVINSFAINNGINFSQAITKLVDAGISNIELNKSMKSYVEVLDRIYSKLYFNTALLEQLYSDLEIDTLSNPNKNPALEKFRIKFNRSYFDK